MKTLVGAAEPDEPERPETVYCITSMGPGNQGFTVPAVFLPYSSGWTWVGNTTVNGSTATFTYYTA